MTILEHCPKDNTVLDFIDLSIRQLSESDVDARYIVVGTQAYERLRLEISERFSREPGFFEHYQHVPVVLDPFRKDEVCVVPSPRICSQGVNAVRIPAPA